MSKTIEEALLANRISYLGSVFLPLSMVMIIMEVCKLHYKKWMPTVLLIISCFVFCVAASPRYLNIYYEKVSNNDTEKTNEVATDDVADSESSIEIAVAIAEDSMPKLEDVEFINESLIEQQEHFWGSIDKLTPTEKMIYDLYLQNKTTKEIMGLLSITENTLKYHNKNIYGKLGVSSRKQLVEIAKELAELGKL